MTLREYLYFKKLFKEIEQKAGNLSWLENFFMRQGHTTGGEIGRLDVFMTDVYNAGNYEEVPDVCYDVGNVTLNRDIDKMLGEMEVLSDYYDKSRNSFNELDVETKHNTALDYEFFQRMVSFFSDANSVEGKKINEQLSEVNKVLSAGNVALDNDEYVEKINQLEKSLDAYLQESVFAGVQEKGTDLEVKALNGEDARRINAATAMKEYIGDIRKEKFKESIRDEIQSRYLKLITPKDDELSSSYAKREAAISVILSNIDKMVEKHNSIRPDKTIKKNSLDEFKAIMENARAGLWYYRRGHFDAFKKELGISFEKNIADIFMADIVLNEILSNGGEAFTASFTELLWNAENEKDIYLKYLRNNRLLNKDEFTTFIKKSYKENVLDALHNGFSDIAPISDRSYRLKKEQRTECVETASEKATIAMAYGNLAKFAKSINDDVLKNKFERAADEQRKRVSYEYLRLTAERKVRRDEAVVKSVLGNNTDPLILARYFVDAFALNQIKSEEEHLADAPDAFNSVRTLVSENDTLAKIRIMQNSSEFKNILLLQNTPMFKNVLDQITAGNVKNLDDIMKLMPAQEVEKFIEDYFANLNQTVNAQNKYQEETLSKLDLVTDHPVKGDYEKLVKQLIANAKADKVSDPSFDSIVERINLCFDEGAKEKELIRVMSDLEKVEQDLSEQMLDDDSNALREKYAFVINLQSKLEAYMDADKLVEEAKAPSPVSADDNKIIPANVEEEENVKGLKEFYDNMQLSFLDSKVCKSLCASDNNYKSLVDGIKKAAKRIVQSINDEEPVKEDDIGSLSNCLWLLNSENLDLKNKDTQNCSEEEFNDYKKNVNTAFAGFSTNRQEYIGEVVNNQEDDLEYQDLEDFGIPQNYSTKNDFNEIAKKLNKAKTKHNSGIYNNLVKAVENLDKETTVDQDKNLTDEQKYAVKLWAIKKQIDMYLDHKAQKGVNQNAYDKLVAVEELNKMVSGRLQQLAVQPFKYEKHDVNVKAFNLTYQEDVAEQSAKRSKGAPNRLSQDDIDEKVESARELYIVDKEDFRNADDCMCRIIARAGKRERELIEMRSKFQNHPAREIKTAPTMQMNP